MFHVANQNLITRLKIMAETGGNQVNGFCRATGEYDFTGALGVDERPDLFACTFVIVSRAVTQCMYTAMHVGMVVFVVMADRVDDGLRSL